MNIRKNVDYTEMYSMLDNLMGRQLPQMELYCKTGKVVGQRAEKGAAVMAAEYLHKHYPDVSGFSPRNVRRMRDFYRTYENYPKLRKLAMQIGWIQNVVIMEADLTMELREWYLRAAMQFGWSKAELIANIADKVHEKIIPDIDEGMCYNEQKKSGEVKIITVDCYMVLKNPWSNQVRNPKGKKRQRCRIQLCFKISEMEIAILFRLSYFRWGQLCEVNN